MDNILFVVVAALAGLNLAAGVHFKSPLSYGVTLFLALLAIDMAIDMAIG